MLFGSPVPELRFETSGEFAVCTFSALNTSTGRAGSNREAHTRGTDFPLGAVSLEGYPVESWNHLLSCAATFQCHRHRIPFTQ